MEGRPTTSNTSALAPSRCSLQPAPRASWPAEPVRAFSLVRALRRRYAGAAAVGLLAVTATALARSVFELHPALLGGAVLVFAAERFGLSPVLLLVIAAGVGAAGAAVVS